MPSVERATWTLLSALVMGTWLFGAGCARHALQPSTRISEPALDDNVVEDNGHPGRSHEVTRSKHPPSANPVNPRGLAFIKTGTSSDDGEDGEDPENGEDGEYAGDLSTDGQTPQSTHPSSTRWKPTAHRHRDRHRQLPGRNDRLPDEHDSAKSAATDRRRTANVVNTSHTEEPQAIRRSPPSTDAASREDVPVRQNDPGAAAHLSDAKASPGGQTGAQQSSSTSGFATGPFPIVNAIGSSQSPPFPETAPGKRPPETAPRSPVAGASGSSDGKNKPASGSAQPPRPFPRERENNALQKMPTVAQTRGEDDSPLTKEKNVNQGKQAHQNTTDNAGKTDETAEPRLLTTDRPKDGAEPKTTKTETTKSDTTVKVPLKQVPGSDNVEISGSAERINLSVREAPLNAVLAVLAQQQGLNIVAASDVTDPVSVTLHDVPLNDALDSVLAIAGCTWVKRKDIIYVTKVDSGSAARRDVQNREIRVFPLNYIGAADVEKSIKGLLSPMGKSFMAQTDPVDKRRTRERIVVEDLPENLSRIEAYIAQVDRPPLQVLIEVHVLQVTLNDEMRHGVNFEFLEEIAGRDLALSAVGLANPVASPAAFFSFDGTDLDVLVEALQNTTDSKTLASPKVMVLNGQNAKIQIGERLPFFVTTTTETSTLQDVRFLDVGVVLDVTPQITADGQILMYVKPKISGGQILPESGLPREETTEVETTVMLPDGRGIIIGGLIQETDDDQQSKIPFLGDLWLVGRAFQRRTAQKERRELIVALVPRIVPYGAPRTAREEAEWNRATTPLFHGALDRTFRPEEPLLPDAVRNPRRIRFDRLPHFLPNLRESHPLRADYYFPPASKNDRVRPTRAYD